MFDLTDINAVSINGGNVTRLVGAINMDSVDDFCFTHANTLFSFIIWATPLLLK